MTGSFAKNRANDFARYANLGGKPKLRADELRYLVNACGDQARLTGSEMEKLALLESERMYRISCALAYGSNPTGTTRKAPARTHKSTIAAKTDISRFAQVESYGSKSLNEAGDEEVWYHCIYKIKLPYDAKLLGVYPDKLRTPSKYHASLEPVEYDFGSVTQEITDAGDSQTFTLCSYNQEPDLGFIHEPFRILAQVIINARIASNLVGIFDGKSLFETERDVDLLWQTLAELTVGQAPGICPVCGKIIDRRRGKSGGHPPIACKNHIHKFHNELKKVVKNSPDHDPSEMIYPSKCEAAIRELRWEEGSTLNERPLQFAETSFL